ncbi:MAG: DNA mismatch repair endonuclease MutL [Candidatus Woesearchaeota archaeon]
MATIHKLEKETIEKIAAGEVIERPANILKELLENSLDANATNISIQLEQGGLKKIQIQDNGIGMDESDLKLCVERHATSKISSIEDLNRVQTLGFRGEALASICAVSKVQIVSKTQSMNAGICYDVFKDSLQTVASTTGTTITVSDLFYNTPARKKFLKTQSTEFARCLKLISSYSLARTQVHFTVSHNGNVVFTSPNARSFQEKFQYAYSREIAKSMVALSYSQDGLVIEGVVSKPEQTRSDKTGIVIHVNGRLVTNYTLVQALVDGYETLLMKQRYPYALLNIEVDPQIIDVNVHPKKDVVKFENESQLYGTIRGHIKKIFLQTTLTPKISQDTLYDRAHVYSQKGSEVLEKNSFTKTTGGQKIESQASQTSSTQGVLEKTSSFIGADSTNSQTTIADAYLYIGVVLKTYIVCQKQDEMVLIDFHGAHERYHYELFMEAFTQKTVQKQQLLEPIIIELSQVNYQTAIEYQEVLDQMGIEIDQFGPLSLAVKTIPSILGKTIQKEFLLDIIQDMSKSKDVFEKKIISLIASKACKASARSGDDISDEMAKKIMRFMLCSKMKYACPHGRPTMISLSRTDLDKLFKRIV